MPVDDTTAIGRSATTAGEGPTMRFNHMELTFPVGTLTKEFREEIDAFYCSVFGWKASDTEVVGQTCHLLMPDPDQFILLAESKRPMSSPGYDHLGLLQDTREEVDDLLAACDRYAEKDDRVKIKRYEDLVYPGLTVHAFYVKYLLPIYFDVQNMERSPGAG
jgi:Glyoxalase/Bleomycin resistance protein/Dioxygenase superfamily